MVERHPIKYLAPAWFAVIMGTGGLGNILYLGHPGFPLGQQLGTGVAVIADLLYFVVLVPWIMRWLNFYRYVQRDLHHPLTSNFFVTMPVATAILGTNIYIIWRPYLGDSVTYTLTMLTWIIALSGVTFFTFYTTFRMMQVENSPKPELINFSWIMAPIANMAVLLIGNPVLSLTLQYHAGWALTVLIVNGILLGIGFFLFLFISAIVFVRLAQHPLPPVETTPSFGILLSAVGLAVSAILDLSKNANSLGILNSTDLANIFAVVIWGFGFWVVGLIILISIYQLRRGGIPFSLGWWAFIFPLAAYTLASQKVSTLFTTPVATIWTTGLTFLLMGLWLYTFLNTLKGVISGQFFTGVPIPHEAKNNSVAS